MLVGLDIGGTKCAVVLADNTGTRPKIISRQVFATADYPGPDAALAKLDSMIADLNPSELEAIGISCGGPLNSRSGLILSPPNLPGWDAVPIVKHFRSYGVPVRLMNDANAGALAEWKWGAGQGTSTMAFFTFGTGLGAGLIIDGRLFEGPDDLAGEVGHWRMAEAGPVGFGKEGSLEGFASGGGIGRLAVLRGFNGDAKQVAQAARDGDQFATSIIDEAAFHFGRALALIIDLLNPEALVLGSLFLRCEDLFRPRLEAVIKRESLAVSVARCHLVPAQLGEQIGDYAALAAALY